MIKKLDIVYVVPSRYDDDGYVQRWTWGVVPSNSLAVIKSLTRDMIDKKALPDLDILLESYDDNIQKIPFDKIARRNLDPETKVVVGIVGVQSNQFPRASDIAMRFRKLGVDVMIGGFHVTGVIALFDKLTPELQLLTDNGVALIAGEAETPGTLEKIFTDAIDNNLQQVYRLPKAPDLTNAPLPKADPQYIDHFGARWATIDSSRGCPFGCTFCTVINIQGRKMRCRSSEAVIETVKQNCDNGIPNFFFTDDNFARSAHWETIFDALAEMRENGSAVNFMMQIDTQSSKIPNFVDKAVKAGCRMVFIGMESVNPDNIAEAGKTQNKVEQYQTMVQTWQKSGVIVHVGYIIGFPNDTIESVKRDVLFLRDHVGVDLASFFMLTPLPGSVDHFEMVKRGAEIDPDLNKYDSFHETFVHKSMKPGEWKSATKLAYVEFYTKEHCTKILKRLPKDHYWLMFWNLIWYRYSGVLSGTHPMMTGFFRRKDRLDRRPGMPRENIFKFAYRWIKDFVLDSGSYIKLFFEFQEIWFLTRRHATLREKTINAVLETADEAAITTTLSELPKTTSSRYLTRIRHWAPLAQLKSCWNSLQQRVAEYNWKGQYETAVLELKNQLKATATKLRLMASVIRQDKHKAKALEVVAVEIDNCLNEIDTAPANSKTLYKIQQFVSEKLLSRYEEMSSSCVRLRRYANRLRVNTLENFKKGKVINTGVGFVKRTWFLPIEAFLSLRFFVAVFRKEI
ncbi:MAG: radical SAM protein [Planctomycetaceae bacterium]|nr:radical SAM protein [Planctomycetaceae bacterium]